MPDKEMAKYSKKVCLVGDPEVGKTCLVRRFVVDQYDDSYIQTIGAKVMKKNVRFEGDKNYDINLMVWDVMGQKHFKIIESVAFQHIQGVLIVCDITRKSTLDNVQYWVDAVQRISGKVPIIILGNKKDLINLAEFDEKDLAKVAEAVGATYHTTSAKTGENVEVAFFELAKMTVSGVRA